MASNENKGEEKEGELLAELARELESMKENPALLQLFTEMSLMAMEGRPLPSDDEETKCHLLGLRMYPEEEKRLTNYPQSALVDSISGVYKVPFNFVLSLILPCWVLENAKYHNLEYVNRIEHKFNFGKKIRCGYDFSLVVTGSKAQGLSVPKLVHLNQGASNYHISSDLDVMFVRDEPLESCTTFDISATFPGYLRLRHESAQCNCGLLGALYEEEVDGFISGDIFQRLEQAEKHTERVFKSTVTNDGKTIQDVKCNVQITRSGPSRAATGHIQQANVRPSRISIDEVDAINSLSWPVDASGWITRPKPSGWPSEALVMKVTSMGCQVVPVAHCTSTSPDIEWRFSFTGAEKLLALSMTTSQRQTFVVFKVLVSFVIAPYQVVSTFCLKNIMLWAMEKLPQDKWDDKLDGTAVCLTYLLDQLIHCLAEYNLPHYFIPENNLLEGKDKQFVIDIGKRVIQFRKHLVEICLTYNANISLVSFRDLESNFLKRSADFTRNNQWRFHFWRVKFDTQLMLALHFGMRCHTDDFEGMYDNNQLLVEDVLQHDVPNDENVALQCGICWCFIVVFVKRNIFGKQREKAVHFLRHGLRSINGPLKIIHLVYLASYLILNGLSEDAASLLSEALSLAKERTHEERTDRIACVEFHSNSLQILEVIIPDHKPQFNFLHFVSLEPLVIICYLLVKYYVSVDNVGEAERLIPLLENQFGGFRRIDAEIDLLKGAYRAIGRTGDAENLNDKREAHTPAHN